MKYRERLTDVERQKWVNFWGREGSHENDHLRMWRGWVIWKLMESFHWKHWSYGNFDFMEGEKLIIILCYREATAGLDFQLRWNFNHLARRMQVQCACMHASRDCNPSGGGAVRNSVACWICVKRVA